MSDFLDAMYKRRTRTLRIARVVANKVTDEMLAKPVKDLTEAEVAILQAALSGPYADEIVARMDAR